LRTHGGSDEYSSRAGPGRQWRIRRTCRFLYAGYNAALVKSANAMVETMQEWNLTPRPLRHKPAILGQRGKTAEAQAVRASFSKSESGVWKGSAVSRVALLLLLLLTACTGGRRGIQLEDIPTVANIDMLATAVVLTENAPPEGFRGPVSFPRVDQGLSSLPGWRYVVTLQFDGTFSDVPRDTSASATAEVWYNQLGSARRVVVSTSGELLGSDTDTSYEAVRLGPDAFLVREGACLANAGRDAEIAAGLTAGELVGGVEQAQPAGRKAVLNGEEAYLYTFSADDLHLPSITLEEGGTLQATGELWVAPEHNAVVRFYATLDLTRARIFGRALPVDGRVIVRYDVYDIGEPFNITQPFGC